MQKDDLYKAALSKYRSKEFAESIILFRQSLALNENWQSYQGLGLALNNIGQHEPAVDAFKKSLALKENWESYQGFAILLLKTKQYQEAINAFNKSLALQENWVSYQGLALVLLETKQYQEAINAFNKSLALKENWYSYQRLALAFFISKQYQEAINAFNKSLALQENWESCQGLAIALFHVEQYKEAINEFNKSLQMQENWISYLVLATALLRTKQYQKAIGAFNKSLALQEHLESYQGLATALLRTKQYQEAMVAIYKLYSAQKSGATANLFYTVFKESKQLACKDELLKNFFNLPGTDRNELTEIFLEFISKHKGAIYLNPLIPRMASLILSPRRSSEADNDQQNFLEKIIQKCNVCDQNTLETTFNEIIVFGDSHSFIFNESDGFEVAHVGAGTMHNINNPKSSTGHYQKILDRLKLIDKNISTLGFMFGEIDLRNHILAKSRQKSINPHKVTDKTIDNYFNFLDRIQHEGFKIIVIGPHCGGGSIPKSLSSEVERNDLCAYLNDKLAIKCYERGINFCTLFDIAVNQTTLKNNKQLFSDHCHLKLPDNSSNLIGVNISKIACARVRTATKNYVHQNPSFYKSEILTDCTLVAGNIPNWTAPEFTPGKVSIGKEFILKDKLYSALVELPFGIDIDEVIFVFDGVQYPPTVHVSALNEIFNLSEEFERKNLSESIFKYDNKDGNHIQSHCFTEQYIEDTTCKYILIRISSKASGVRLKSIRIKRKVGHDFKDCNQN